MHKRGQGEFISNFIGGSSGSCMLIKILACMTMKANLFKCFDKI